jgi:two-component system cell cycle sensor histidine kinase/response regulator CckA
MLVDDNREMLELMQVMLTSITDRQINCFLSAPQALAELQAAPDAFQLVITDLDMPEMNGIEFRQAIGRVAPELPVILATGSTTIVEAAARQLGFSGLFRKPSSLQLLRQTIEQLFKENLKPVER